MSHTATIKSGVLQHEWLRELDFYELEIKILQKMLQEVTAKNTNDEARAGIEHFQNQFILQKNNLDELRASIEDHLELTFDDVKDHTGKVKRQLVDTKEPFG